jgi:cell division protein FtsB
MNSKFLKYIKNKYILTTIALVVMITFFDRYDLRTQYELRKELKELQETKKYYETEIQNNKRAISSLQHDSVALEKFAREKYLMKKNNEEIFLVYENKSTSTPD